ncbi:hypothetical protein FOG50_01534 [Hanseniaspora uvarum]|nr:hypothetical protein FOG50_01534 [Hanseniaspora uvarum]
MGVHKLWSLLEPSSKPVKLDSLNDQVLAVDASIWLYQFITALKHQKSKNNSGEFSLEENNVFINAHLLGFFRRICKLLHYGIKPIFIFDGEVCELKKNTIMERKKKKEGNRESSKDVARRILAIQMLNKNLKKKNQSTSEADETEADAIKKHMTQKNSEWDLPEQDKMPTQNDDGRLAAIEDYENTVNQMEDELQGIDLESINPASQEFNNLPKSTQYMILYALRSKSRLRMGYSIEQLKAMFPDPVEFSKFQIEMVKRRNYFSQKLLDSTGKHGNSMISTGKVSGTKKMYMLIKTNNGWAMSLDNNDGSSKETAIDITNDEIEKLKFENPTAIKNDSDSDDWEDVDLNVEKDKEEFVEDYSIKALVDATKNRLMEKTPNKKFDDGNEPVLEVPYFNSAKLTGYKDVGEYNVNLIPEEENKNNVLNDDSGKHDIEEELESESDNEVQKPSKKRQKMMTFSLFDQNDDKKNKPFINLVDESLNKIESPVVDLTDAITEDKNEEKFEKPHNPSPANEELIDDDRDNSSKETDVYEEEPHDLIKSLSKQNLDEIKKPEASPTEMKEHDNFGDPLISRSTTDTEKKDFNTSDSSESFVDVIKAPVEITNNTTNEPFVNENDLAGENNTSTTRSPFIAEENISAVKETTSIKDDKQKQFEEKDAVLVVPPITEKKIGLFDMEEEEEENEPPVAIPKLDDQVVSTEAFEDSEDDFLGIVEPEIKPTQSNKFNQYEFFEDDEEDLVQQMDMEEKDYKDLVQSKDESTLNKIFVDDGNTAVTDSTPHNDILGYSQLISRYKKLQRDAEEVTPQMVEEVQELLQHFGIPYLTAPMEAEAQCAELMRLNIVDGIVTDDSDVFLFGGSKIYRKMFQEKQFVEFYDLHAILGTLGLSRDNLIELAFLLGSDYTLGIKGIGPVAAVEILANFGSLTKFKDWFNQGMHDSEKIAKEKGFEKSLRKKLISNNIILSETWPYADVTKEYKSPTVDKDDTPFKWGKPDLDKLRTLMRNYMSWTDDKTDEVLIPLIKEMNQKSKQAKQRKVTDFFPVDYSIHNYENLSSRLKKAIDKLKDSKA